MIYGTIHANFCMEKIFVFFSLVLMGETFIPLFLSCVNVYIEPMVIFINVPHGQQFKLGEIFPAKFWWYDIRYLIPEYGTVLVNFLLTKVLHIHVYIF